MNVDEAARRLGCGRTVVFTMLKDKLLKRAEKAGRETVVTVANIERYLLTL